MNNMYLKKVRYPEVGISNPIYTLQKLAFRRVKVCIMVFDLLNQKYIS